MTSLGLTHVIAAHFLAALCLSGYVCSISMLFFNTVRRLLGLVFSTTIICHALLVLLLFSQEVVRLNVSGYSFGDSLVFESSPSLLLITSSFVFFLVLGFLPNKTVAFFRFSLIFGVVIFILGGMGIHSGESFPTYRLSPPLIFHITFSILSQVLVYLLVISAIVLSLTHRHLKRRDMLSLAGYPAMASIESMFMWLLKITFAVLLVSLISGAYSMFTLEDNANLLSKGLTGSQGFQSSKIIFSLIFMILSGLLLLAVYFFSSSIPQAARLVSIAFPIILLLQIVCRVYPGNLTHRVWSEVFTVKKATKSIKDN
ncbi:MAG TPA: hypothetical protein PKA63_05410 [Oligoflexia bacterium]|nr:hypothetical protein [Oligoflexia bacterium]HMP48086.1 hypothetical protein [Oligoflexia bacterium]